MGGSGGDQETRMDWEERRVMVWDCGALGAVVGKKSKRKGRKERKKKQRIKTEKSKGKRWGTGKEES